MRSSNSKFILRAILKQLCKTNRRNKCTQRLALSVVTYSFLFLAEQMESVDGTLPSEVLSRVWKTSAILETSDCVARAQTTAHTTGQWDHWKLTRDLSPSKRFSRRITHRSFPIVAISTPTVRQFNNFYSQIALFFHTLCVLSVLKSICIEL